METGPDIRSPSIRLALALLLAWWLPALLPARVVVPTPVADHVVKGTTVPVLLRGVSASMTVSVDDVISQQIGLSADTTASAPLADDLAFFVRRHYLEQGYLKAEIEWAMETQGILLRVNEGIQQQVDQVTFTGNPGLDEAEMKRYLVRPTRERVGRFATSTPYVEKEVAEGAKLVHRYVLSQGYMDAEVDDPVANNHDDGKTDLSMAIRPGEQWHVGAVTLEGEPPRLSSMLQFDLNGLQNQAVNEAHIENTRRQIEGEVQTHGYFVAKVTTATTRAEGHLLNIVLNVVPGSLFQVTQVELDPAFSKGAKRLVGSAYKPAVGHVYDAQRMELAYGHIIDTGIFEHLEMEPKIIGDGELALAFKGEEAKRSSIGLSGGYDTFQGAILGIEYKNVNIFNTGGIFSAKVTGTQLGLQAGLQWKDPAFFNSPYALAIDIKPETFTYDGYTRETLAVRVGISRDFSKHFSAEAFVSTSTSTVTSPTLTPAEVGPEKYNLGTAGVSFIYEHRDNPVSPTRGWFASASIEGGSVSGTATGASFTRTEFAISLYQPLSAKWRTSVGARFGSIMTSADVSDIPIELREYNGGAKGVRSFAERELGPRAPQDGTPLGGLQTDTISGELSYELVKNLELATFVDAGSLDAGKGSLIPNLSGGLRYAAGLGIRYRLPFGPLRVDYGVNLDRRTGESFGALQIGFGFAF